MGQVASGYSDSHTAPGKGFAYDADFRRSTFLSYLWRQERALLTTLLGAEKRRHRPSSAFSYLDFACGTARILSALEAHVDRAVGLDISEEMLRVARNKVSRAELVRGDCRTDRALLREGFHFSTAFRFFPNADPALKQAAARFLARQVVTGGLLS